MVVERKAALINIKKWKCLNKNFVKNNENIFPPQKKKPKTIKKFLTN